MSSFEITASTTDEEIEVMADRFGKILDEQELPYNRERLVAEMIERRDRFKARAESTNAHG